MPMELDGVAPDYLDIILDCQAEGSPGHNGLYPAEQRTQTKDQTVDPDSSNRLGNNALAAQVGPRT